MRRFEELHQENRAEAMEGLSPGGAGLGRRGPRMNAISVLVVHTTGAERLSVGRCGGARSVGARPRSRVSAQGLDAAALTERLARSRAYVRGVLETLSLEDLPAARTFPRDGRQ